MRAFRVLPVLLRCARVGLRQNQRFFAVVLGFRLARGFLDHNGFALVGSLCCDRFFRGRLLKIFDDRLRGCRNGLRIGRGATQIDPAAKGQSQHCYGNGNILHVRYLSSRSTKRTIESYGRTSTLGPFRLSLV